MRAQIINDQLNLIKKPLITIAYLFFLIGGISTAHAVSTDIQIINNDGANEGLNSTASAFAGQTNNAAGNLGAQRLAVFQAAADYWEALIVSGVPIRVGVQMNPLSCDASSAILGSAGPNSVFSDFTNAPLANTWYVEAVANSLAGSDQDGTDDLSAAFNSDIDNNNSCLSGINWWLGINAPAPAGTISLYDTILHEIGHGIGVLSLVDSSGVIFSSKNDSYMYHLYDETTDTYWRNMTNAQRAASAINTNNLVWRGPNADGDSSHLSGGKTNGHIRMYAPNPYQGGSSVSHWDTSLSPDELMEPFATLTSDDCSTVKLLKDVGWNVVENSGEITLSSNKYNIYEDFSPASIIVERTLGRTGVVSVNIATSDISATGANVDYQTINQTLNWADCETSTKVVQIAITDDGTEELAGETALVQLSGETGGATLGTSAAILNILDPDDGFLLSVIPAIVAASQNPQAPPAPPPPPPPPIVNPEWGVIISGVCDAGGPLVFSITQGSATKISTVASCSSAATFKGYVTSTPGSKSFSYLISTDFSGDISGSFPYFLEEAKGYNHVLEFDAGSNLVITTYPFNLSSKIGANSKSNLTTTHIENNFNLVESTQTPSPIMDNSLKHLQSMNIE